MPAWKRSLEAARIRHLCCLGEGEGHAQPGFGRIRFHSGTALDLELEQSSRREALRHLTHVGLNHFVARDVLEHAAGKREIERAIAQHRQRRTVGLVNEGVRRCGQPVVCLSQHLVAYVDPMHLAEHAGQRPGHPACAAPHFKHAHLLRVLALADVHHIGQDVLSDRTHSRGDEIILGPVRLVVHDEMPRVLTRALVPVVAHLAQVFFELHRVGIIVRFR